MLNKKYIFVGAILIILLFSTSISLAQIKLNKIINGPELKLTTDKGNYEIGKIVKIFFTNIGVETLCGEVPIVSYYNEYNELIYREAIYCYWKLEPSEFFNWAWDQKDFTNEQVPVGKYLAEGIISGIEKNYINPVSFNIIIDNPLDPPYGPTEGIINHVYTFCIDLPDSEEHEPYYIIWDWGDGSFSDWLGPFVAEETVCDEHSWNLTGYYEIRVGIRDFFQNITWTDPLIIHISKNNAPSIPIISGPLVGKPGQQYEWTFYSNDPEEDNISYYVDWGDYCGDSDWYGPYLSGEEVLIPKTYYSMGTFTIGSFAADEHGKESDWGSYTIKMPRHKGLYLPFLQLFNIIFRRFLLLI